MGVQVIGSSGQTVNAVGQSTMAVHASVVRAVGALTAAAGATPLIRAAERSVYADTITLAATDGVIVGNGTVDLPTIASQDEDPQAFLISAVGGAITVVPHEDDEAIFGLDNQLVSEVTVEANTVLTLLRYVGVWRVIDSSAASLALGETSSTAYRGDRGKTAYDHSQVTTGNPHGTTAADVGADPAGTAAGLVDDLSGVSNQATARANLGLGTAATAATGDFAAASHTHTGTQVTVDASGFNGNLTTSDDTLQEVAQKLDDLSIPAAGIAASIIDGKGELIVGSADNTVDNLAVGTNGHVLTLDSTQTLGVKWSTTDIHSDLNPVWPNTTDGVAVYPGVGSSAAVSATAVCAVGVTLLRACTVSQVSVNVNAGGATSAVRIGIYNATSGGRPGTLVYDCGTVASTSGGVKTITLAASQALAAGLYFIATSLDTGTAPTLYGMTGGTSGGSSGSRGAISDNNLRIGNYYFTTTSGAMTSSPTWTLGLSSGAVAANFRLVIASVP